MRGRCTFLQDAADMDRRNGGGTVLLAELLEQPSLGLRLLHAPDGSLERPVGRTITIDLLEPGRYLNGGELVLTGLVWRRGPEDSETFVSSIAEGGATCLL